MSALGSDRAAQSVVAGEGATLRLADGSSIIDFETGGFGHGAAPTEQAVREQMMVNPLATRHFLSLPLATLATRLADVCPGQLDISYFGNSSAEAVEGALKLARGFHRDRRRFVAISGGYHGSTLGALSVCGIATMREPFTHLPLAVDIAPEPDRARDFVDAGTAGVIVEPWPGGARPSGLSAGWLTDLAERCAETGALLIADETRSGIGRTGTMFAVEHEGVTPDVLVLGGALGGGVLPVAGYVAARRVNDRVYGRRDPTLHANATGGNPAACAAALATLKMVASNGFMDRITTCGELLRSGLQQLAATHSRTIDEVCGLGLFACIRFRRPEDAIAVAVAAFEGGLALRQGGGFERPAEIELQPPMLVAEDEIRAGLEVLGDALAKTDSLVVGSK